MLQAFKKLVDTTNPTIEQFDKNIVKIYKHLNIDSSTSFTSQKINDTLYAQIRSALETTPNNETIPKVNVRKLADELVYRFVLFDEDPIPYVKVLRVIQDSCRTDGTAFPSQKDKNRWTQAISNAKDFLIFSPSIFAITSTSIRSDYSKTYEVAISVKILMSKGCEIDIVNSDIVIKSGLEKVVGKISEDIKEYGGLALAKSLFSHLVKLSKYSPVYERYMLSREVNFMSTSQKPQIPYGYLLNMAVRYPFEAVCTKNDQKRLDDIIELSVALCNGAYGVQEYNAWAFHFQTPESIIKFCTNIALWDSIYSIPQGRPGLALEVNKELYDWLGNADFKDIFGFTLDELLAVSTAIFEIADDGNGPVTIYYSEVKKKVKNIDKEIVLRILKFLSHKKDVNQNLKLPSDYTDIDFFLLPLLKLGETKFLLMDKSWCAPAFYEVMATKIRDSKYPDFDKKIGKALEMLVNRRFGNKGITYHYGVYRVDGKDGECDIVIESDKSIILIELKKKVLTRKSKSGLDVNIILDLAGSLLDAQCQSGRTEIILREKGEIDLIDENGDVHKLEYKKRKIERVALTQLDFGGFQDRAIINQFLRVLTTHSFKTYSSDEAIIKKFNKLEEKRQLWLEQYDKLVTLDSGFTHFPFFNCWFLNLPQLLEVIELSTNNDTFCKLFLNTKHVHTGSLDFYQEFQNALRLRTAKLA